MGVSFETMLSNSKNKKPESRAPLSDLLIQTFFIMKAYLAVAYSSSTLFQLITEKKALM